MSRVLVMAGGTGGHIFPALAVSKLLVEEGVEVTWLGARSGLEEKLVGQTGIPFDGINVKGIRQSGWKRKVTMPLMLLIAIYQSLQIFRKRKPLAVLGMGGFVSGPGGLVAAFLRVPLVLHEQNAVAGMTNQWLSRVSKVTLSGFPEARGINKFEWVGNPVRKDILSLPAPAERLSNRFGTLRILVIGGSLGAQVFNEYLPNLLKDRAADFCEIRHQCGRTPVETVKERYRFTRIKSDVSEFIDDMADAYAWADIVICRSGAMTVSEVCAAGVVAIFVPYPYAVSDHQTINAEYLVSQEAAFCISQEKFIGGRWTEILDYLSEDRAALVKMATQARLLSKPEAAHRAATTCVEVTRA
ncbi:MAG: undecaprenyldiphospho-muramoylpentapeptide beta-N-acetylglucosaminyltransferase [Gammaproteobacteria bacterium]|nr:undecaprenyldiphospho-muramoylpentapeptide beta-N-acetylglucosaminyltransferase [Gammaproteobacteria bacterium]